MSNLIWFGTESLSDIRYHDRMNLRFRALTLLFLVVGSACTGSDERTGALIVRRDSLGISIVESAGPSEEWSMSVGPILDLGFEDRELYVFSSIQDMSR